MWLRSSGIMNSGTIAREVSGRAQARRDRSKPGVFAFGSAC